MTKASLVQEISKKTDIEKEQILAVVEMFMKLIRNSMTDGDNVYLRGFGTFQIKHRALKKARNITKGTEVIIPPRAIVSFKPSKRFAERVKKNVATDKQEHDAA